MGRTNRRRDRWTKRALQTLVRPFVRRSPCTLDQIVAERPQRILLVRQHNQMGDMLCATPAFRALRQTFPGARFLLVTAPVNDGVVRNNPHLDEVLLFDKAQVRRSPAEAWRLLRRLRGFSPDVAFVLNTVSFSATSAWMALLSGARHIVGGSSLPFGWSMSTWMYDLEMPIEPDVVGHAIDHGLRPLEAIGIRCEDRQTVLVPGQDAEVAADEFLRSIGPPPWAAVHPGAGKAANRWPAERFARAIRALESEGAQVYLIEGPTDAEATRETLAALGAPRPVLREVDLRTVAAALAQSHVALVNDTGIMHVAGAVGVPTVALFGPTPSECWRPPSPELLALQSPDQTMEGLAVDEALVKLRERLARGRMRANLPEPIA